MADSEESSNVPRKPRRRWLQVSLRTMLILLTLLGVWLGWVVHRGERQLRAVAILKEMGAVIFYDPPDSVPAENPFDLSRWLPRDYFDDVYMVSLSGSKVTGPGTVGSRWLIGSREPDLGTVLNDTLTVDLLLSDEKDACMAHLKALTGLQELDLSRAPVTDADLAYVRGLTHLEALSLDGTNVTDVGMRHLLGLSRLQWLHLKETEVTDAGIEKLQRALPKCKIWH